MFISCLQIEPFRHVDFHCLLLHSLLLSRRPEPGLIVDRLQRNYISEKTKLFLEQGKQDRGLTTVCVMSAKITKCNVYTFRHWVHLSHKPMTEKKNRPHRHHNFTLKYLKKTCVSLPLYSVIFKLKKCVAFIIFYLKKNSGLALALLWPYFILLCQCQNPLFDLFSFQRIHNRIDAGWEARGQRQAEHTLVWVN